MMFDEQGLTQLVALLTEHCCPVKPEQTVIVESIEADVNLVRMLTERIEALGAVPLLQQKTHAGMAAFAMRATTAEVDAQAYEELENMRQAQHFIGIRKPDENNAFATVSFEQKKLLLEHFVKPVHYQYRNHHLNWVYLRNPSQQPIGEEEINKEEFLSRYQAATLINYSELDKLLTPLQHRLKGAKQIHILSPGTDLHCTLGGYDVYKSVGRHNLPDGEIFTAPVKESVTGTIAFNIASNYYEHRFADIKLRFENGRVVEASANDSVRLNQFLDVDEGARYVGEFALGVNPMIRKPIGDILYDEKMFGSLHLALGNAYPIADNGNRSAIHWDLILDQSQNSGGGQLYFDGELVRQNGIFLPEDLQPLNFKIKH